MEVNTSYHINSISNVNSLPPAQIKELSAHLFGHSPATSLAETFQSVLMPISVDTDVSTHIKSDTTPSMQILLSQLASWSLCYVADHFKHIRHLGLRHITYRDTISMAAFCPRRPHQEASQRVHTTVSSTSLTLLDGHCLRYCMPERMAVLVNPILMSFQVLSLWLSAL